MGRLTDEAAAFGAAAPGAALAAGFAGAALGAALASGLGGEKLGNTGSAGRVKPGLGAAFAAGLDATAAAGALVSVLPVNHAGAVRKGLPCDVPRFGAGALDSGLRGTVPERFTVSPRSPTLATVATRITPLLESIAAEFGAGGTHLTCSPAASSIIRVCSSAMRARTLQILWHGKVRAWAPRRAGCTARWRSRPAAGR